VQVWRSLDEVRQSPGERTAATIGVFDGVHRGHRSAIARLVGQATPLGARPVVVTFDPHPLTVVRPDAAPLMLTTLERRLSLLAGCEVDATLVLTFDRALSLLPADEFVQSVLVETLRARRVVVGANFRFGRGAAGDVELLAHRGPDDGFEVDAVELLRTDDVVSSTRIRALVAAGDVAAAADALGRPHLVEGPVVRGDARGRELGVPTANVQVAERIAVPADGVYAGRLVRASGERLDAAVSIGTNPTFDGVERRVEAHVLDRDLDLYDEQVAVEFVDRIRGQRRFESVDELLAAMKQDISDTRRMLAGDGGDSPST
jgi:riboflavin kinase/FMN adenylyltransferase